MIPAAFDYVPADSVQEAIALLAEHGEDAKLLAGGHSLLPMMKLRLATPLVLIGLRRIADHSYVRIEGDAVAIGALTRHCDVAASEVLHAEAPLVAHAASLVGDPQVRHRGTIGGSLAHADPAADLPTAVLAANATLVAEGPGGRRELPATEFFRGYFETALSPAEMLTEIRVPRTGRDGWHYEKFSRRANDWAIVAVATVQGRIALAHMADRPIRADASEAALRDGASAEEAAQLAADNCSPTADMHADAAYRRHLARVLTRRALVTAGID